MKKVRFALLLVAAAALPSRSRPAQVPGRTAEGGMAKKRSATPDVAGYDKQHGPHYDFEAGHEPGREHASGL